MHETKKYCPFCGGVLLSRVFEGRERLVCDICGETIYENPLPATCAVTFDDAGRILLTRRAVEPEIGEWCLPGGFIEIDETPQECVLRELCEETGIIGEITRQLGVEGQASWLYVNVVIAGFLVKAIGGELHAGDDVSEAIWFKPEDAPKLAFPSHQKIFERGFEVMRGDL